MKKYCFALFVFLTSVCTAHASRFLPQNALPGDLRAAEYPYVKISDSVLKFAPGARIFDTENRMILPHLLPAEVAVFYQLDLSGKIINLWLATPEEQAERNSK